MACLLPRTSRRQLGPKLVLAQVVLANLGGASLYFTMWWNTAIAVGVWNNFNIRTPLYDIPQNNISCHIRKTASRRSNKFQHNLQFIKWTGIEFKAKGTDSSLSMWSGYIFFHKMLAALQNLESKLKQSDCLEANMLVEADPHPQQVCTADTILLSNVALPLSVGKELQLMTPLWLRTCVGVLNVSAAKTKFKREKCFISFDMNFLILQQTVSNPDKYQLRLSHSGGKETAELCLYL